MEAHPKRQLAATCCAALVALTGLLFGPAGSGPSRALAAEPDFALPFRCGETWYGRTYSNHGFDGTDFPLDFNHLNTTFEASAPVVASAAGTVAVSDFDGWNSGYGSYVRIDHAGGWSSVYAHLSGSPRVSVGSSVARGTRIGTVGSSGNAEGVHLHFEQRLNGIKEHIRFHGALVAYSYGYPGNPFQSDNCNAPPPPPDDDGDGVPNGSDPCPSHTGSNGGCPELSTQRVRGDFNGDGLEDVVVPHHRPSDGGLNLWLFASTGSGFKAPVLWAAGPAGFEYLSQRPVAGDFNGDGLDDVVIAHRRASNGGLNLWFFASTGASFAAPSLWADGPSEFLYSNLRLAAGDFSGDGLDDVLVAHERPSNGGVNLWVFRSTGTGLAAPALWADNPAGFSFDTQRLLAGDFDADGRDDALVVHRRSSDGGVNLWVFVGTGSSFAAPSAWASDPSGFIYDTLRMTPGDLNGDGADDLAVIHRRNSNGGINLWFFGSTKAALLQPANWFSNPSGFSYDQSGIL